MECFQVFLENRINLLYSNTNKIAKDMFIISTEDITKNYTCSWKSAAT